MELPLLKLIMDETKKLLVLKKDGSSEVFNPDKIAKVAHAAGLSEDEALDISEKITNKLMKENANKITSLRIRNMVAFELKKRDKYAHDLYIWYEKTKDKNGR